MDSFNPPLPNPALYTDEKHEIYIAESPELKCGPTDCIVHVRCNGICGHASLSQLLPKTHTIANALLSSDIHFWKHGQIGELNVTCPYVLGHEGAGVIAFVGSAVTSLQIGDRVAIEPGVPCGECKRCSQGEYNLCLSV